MAIDAAMPVLIVDDFHTMVRILRSLLGQLGFQDIDDASDGGAALAKMRAKPYGLVISDWNMLPMSGLDFLVEMRADTRFIMVTAEGKIDSVIAARKAGVDSYIVKPFNAQSLRTKVEAACALWRPSVPA